MLKRLLIIFIISLFYFPVYSQTIDSLNTGAQPKSGIQKLALAYYKIDFTKEQRKQLENVTLEFIYSIDTVGTAILEEVNGISDAAILDSLKRTPLPSFYPKTVNGVKVNALYFMQFSFPKYRIREEPLHPLNNLTYKEYTLEDFEYIRKAGNRMDLVFGGVCNEFMGNAGKHLGVGGGMKMDLMFTGKKGIGSGLVMSFYGNKLKQEYLLSTNRDQNSTPPTMLLGVGINKFIFQQEHREFNLQLEVCYAIQNITPKLNESDQEWTQLEGFSPGLVANYLVKISKDKVGYYYGSPLLRNNYLNLHGAVRPVFLNLKQASGMMLELGISYRMGLHAVSEYKLKP